MDGGRAGVYGEERAAVPTESEDSGEEHKNRIRNPFHEGVLQVCAIGGKRQNLCPPQRVGGEGNRVDEQDIGIIVVYGTDELIDRAD